MLLPLPGSASQAWYSEPYVIERQVGRCDYLVKTPDRKHKTRLCHVKLSKPCLTCSANVSPVVKSVAMLIFPSSML